jgi:hypothetical protein
MGAISGAIAGGFSGYSEALKQGKNMWWGSKVTYGNTKWSFFNVEKPYAVSEFNIKNVGNKFKDDCLPTTYSELDSPAFGDTYDYNANKTGYVQDVGAMSSKQQFIDYMKNEYGASRIGLVKLNDPDYISQLINQGDRISLHATKGFVNIDHVDVIRKIEYFKSGKTVVTMRIGSYTIKELSQNNIWYFRVPNSFQIQQQLLNSNQQLYNSFLHFK